jgi:hypothetical protein
LRLRTAGITAADKADRLLQDTDGTFDGVVISAFHRLGGDLNGDAVVDARDLVIARNGMLGVLDHGLAVWADVDGDGKIELNDYLAVRKQIGKKV